jgi:hypothetical protein
MVCCWSTTASSANCKIPMDSVASATAELLLLVRVKAVLA